MNVNVDLISNGQGQGPMANKLANSSVGKMRPWMDANGNFFVTVYTGGNPKKQTSYKNIAVHSGTLRRDEWKALDEAILAISDYRLGGVQDLIDKGLTYTLGNPMGTTVLEWHDQSDAMEADLTMDGVTRSKGDRPVFNFNYLPIPIIHVDYEINARALNASRSLGNPLDTTSAERAARKVSEKLEDMLFTNITYSFGEKDSRNRNAIYSYINFPDRNTQTITAWDADSAKTPKDIVDDVKTAKQAMIDARQYGPYTLYVPTAYETVLDGDYYNAVDGTVQNATSDTVRDRIMKIAKIDSIKVIDSLPTDNVLLVQMNRETVRLVRGMGLTNVQWSTEGNFVNKYKVFTIQVPQIRSDQDGRCGIVHMSV